jgi:hypothetical protein
MWFRFIVATFLCIAGGLTWAELPRAETESGDSRFSVDLSASGLLPFTWAQDSPTLPHLGVDALLGLEYATPISVPIRLELGYILVAHSRIAPTGELYRAWDGARFALLAGYSFSPIEFGKRGWLSLSLLGGGALTAAEYSGTPLAYAYPSLIVEPRAVLELGRGVAGRPYLALPTELMFRAGNHTIAFGLGLGWRYQFGGTL